MSIFDVNYLFQEVRNIIFLLTLKLEVAYSTTSTFLLPVTVIPPSSIQKHAQQKNLEKEIPPACVEGLSPAPGVDDK